MISLLLLCASPHIKNISHYPWNSDDQHMLEYAIKRCKEQYIDQPCLKYFFKYAKKDYYAICGFEKGNKDK